VSRRRPKSTGPAAAEAYITKNTIAVSRAAAGGVGAYDTTMTRPSAKPPPCPSPSSAAHNHGERSGATAMPVRPISASATAAPSSTRRSGIRSARAGPPRPVGSCESAKTERSSPASRAGIPWSSKVGASHASSV
jgi:hypothetical protein